MEEGKIWNRTEKSAGRFCSYFFPSKDNIDLFGSTSHSMLNVTHILWQIKKRGTDNILLRLIINKENRKHVTNLIDLKTESVIL